MSDVERAARGFLTVETLKELVDECLGAVPVLAVVGRCRSGKTWASKDWVNAQAKDTGHVAYVDCQGIAFGRDARLVINGVERGMTLGQYPHTELEGIGIVVVDEPSMDAALVGSLIAHTSPEAGAAEHRLVVLLLQHTRLLNELALSTKQVRCYSIAGLPLEFVCP